MADDGTQSQCSPVWETGTIKSLKEKLTRAVASQCSPVWETGTMVGGRNHENEEEFCLNVVRSGRPEQLTVPPRASPHMSRLNVVRSGRPEQFREAGI